MKVIQIPHALAIPYYKRIHYAKKVPIMLVTFGLYMEKDLVGVLSYGPPARPLNNGYGIFDGKLEMPTFELNRLCLEKNTKNQASFFVSQTLKLMKKPCCLVSYADSNVGHIGFVYQATNWLYTGLTPKRRRFVRRGKALHERTVVGTYGTSSSEGLPDDVDIEEQSGKHRYVYFLGSKKEKKLMKKLLAYPISPYPKGETTSHESGNKIRKIPSFGSMLR